MHVGQGRDIAFFIFLCYNIPISQEACQRSLGSHYDMVFTSRSTPVISRRIALAVSTSALIAGILLLAASTVGQASGDQLTLTGNSPIAPPSPCSPISFGTPTELDLSVQPNGLSVQADQPTQYQIFGSSAAQLRTQIQQCGPGATGTADAEFTGQTAYNLSWQYSAIDTGDSCSVSDMKVGLHTAIAIPYWQPSNTAAQGLGSRWQHFVSGLTTHEDGHAAIDKLYAAKLTTDLSGIQNVPCNSLASDVNATAKADTAALNQANDTYDASTNHGATQGAVLPTY